MNNYKDMIFRSYEDFGEWHEKSMKKQFGGHAKVFMIKGEPSRSPFNT